MSVQATVRSKNLNLTIPHFQKLISNWIPLLMTSISMELFSEMSIQATVRTKNLNLTIPQF